MVSQLIATGKVQHAYLGVGIATITDALSSQLGLPAGVEVTQVTPGGPADDAGFKAAEAKRFFGQPPALPPRIERDYLTPWPANAAEARFLERFRAVAG